MDKEEAFQEQESANNTQIQLTLVYTDSIDRYFISSDFWSGLVGPDMSLFHLVRVFLL